MRTEVSIVAAVDASPRIAASGGLAVRRTGPHTLHLVSAAATPLGGDSISISVVVEPGARLDLRTVAASMVLPSRERPDSVTTWDLTVAEGGRLAVDPQPTIVAGGACHATRTTLRLDAGATVCLTERAQIGRRSAAHLDVDETGSWEGALHVDLDGLPLLRHRTAIGAHHTAPTTHRASASVFRYPDDRGADADPVEFAARLSLARGATFGTALADSAARARSLCDHLDLRAVLA